MNPRRQLQEQIDLFTKHDIFGHARQCQLNVIWDLWHRGHLAEPDSLTLCGKTLDARIYCDSLQGFVDPEEILDFPRLQQSVGKELQAEFLAIKTFPKVLIIRTSVLVWAKLSDDMMETLGNIGYISIHYPRT